MNRTELAKAVSSKVENLTQVKSNEIIEATLEAISEALLNGETITLIGFGTFSLTQRKERRGRNPRTGETLNIPSKSIAKWKPGSALREAVKTVSINA